MRREVFSFSGPGTTDDGERSSVYGSLAERDQAWLMGIRAGDSAAFEAMFRAYFDSLYRLAFHDVQSRAVAEEIIQDVFCTLWDNRLTLEIRDSLERYLVRTVRNRTINFLRHARVEDRHAQAVVTAWDSQGPSLLAPDVVLEQQELDTAIRDAVQQLPPRAREAYLLFHRDGLRYAEVARRMGISVRGVETNLGVALKRLRKQLSKFLVLVA